MEALQQLIEVLFLYSVYNQVTPYLYFCLDSLRQEEVPACSVYDW